MSALDEILDPNSLASQQTAPAIARYLALEELATLRSQLAELDVLKDKFRNEKAMSSLLRSRISELKEELEAPRTCATCMNLYAGNNNTFWCQSGKTPVQNVTDKSKFGCNYHIPAGPQ